MKSLIAVFCLVLASPSLFAMEAENQFDMEYSEISTIHRIEGLNQIGSDKGDVQLPNPPVFEKDEAMNDSEYRRDSISIDESNISAFTE